jgi:hypothetical protein
VTHTPVRPIAVKIGEHLINREEFLYGYSDAVPGKDGPVEGVRVEFRRKGVLFLPGITLDGLLEALNGDPF